MSAFLRDREGFLAHFLHEVCKTMEQEADALVAAAGGKRFKHVVSIGPGNGLFETILFRKYGYDRILLIDIEESGGFHQHGFASESAGYASLTATKTFMAMNGVPESAMQLCNPRKQPLPAFAFDLCLSLLSMGHHYPCDAYVDFILVNMTRNAFVAFDKRKGADDPGYDALTRRLRPVARKDEAKHQRVYLSQADRL